MVMTSFPENQDFSILLLFLGLYNDKSKVIELLESNFIDSNSLNSQKKFDIS